ncbi:MAG: hypothetical protein IT356_12995 [Gemmatimonadaceae bacterium]|nr:hypothetical protein [Gemmatimonadaceae bacterium]
MKLPQIVILWIALLLTAGCAQRLTELPMQSALVMTDLGRSVEQVMLATATPESEPITAPQETPTAEDGFTLDNDVIDQIRRRGAGQPVQQTPDTTCPYMSYDEAVEITFWGLGRRPDGDETLCGYGGLAQKIRDNRDILNLVYTYGVVAGTLNGTESVTFYRNLATLLHRDTGRANGEAYRELMRVLSDGDTSQAIDGLNNIVMAVDWWSTLEFGGSAEQPGMLFINEEAEGGPFILFLSQDAVGDTQLVIAHVYTEADLDLVLDTFVQVIERVASGDDALIPLDLPKQACDYLTAEQATVILGQEVEVDQDEGDRCSYVPSAEVASNDPNIYMGFAFYSGDEALDFFDSVISDLSDDSRRLDADIEDAIDAALAEEDFGAALLLLPDLAVRPESLFFSARPDLGESVVGVEWDTDGRSLHGRMAEGASGELVFFIVSFVEVDDESALTTAMDAFFADFIADFTVTDEAANGIGTADLSAPSAEERLADCYELTPDQVETVLGAVVEPDTTIDEQYGYCVFIGAEPTSAAPGAIEASTDTMPVYGPQWEAPYLAVTVSPVGDATDPIMYMAFAILDRNHNRLGEFLPNLGSATALQELAQAESAMPGLDRQFLADVGDGALWYWQELSSGHHLGGIYVMDGVERVVIQILVDPDQSADDAQSAIVDMVNWLIGDQ